MSYDINRFRELFFDEASEHLAAMESGLLALEAGNHDPEFVHAVFRAAHSVKGVAGSLGFTAIAEFTHLVESVLGRFRDGSLAVRPELVALIVQATDGMRALVVAAATGNENVDVSGIAAALSMILHAEPTSVAPQAAPEQPSADRKRYEIRFAPKPEFFATGQDVMLVLRELTALDTESIVAVDTSRLPQLDALEPQRCYLAWTITLSTTASRAEIEDVFLFIGDDSEIVIREIEADAGATPAATIVEPPVQAPVASMITAAAAAPPPTSIRVAAEKVDALVDLVESSSSPRRW